MINVLVQIFIIILYIVYREMTIVLNKCTNCCDDFGICWYARPIASRLIVIFHAIVNKLWSPSSNHFHARALFFIYRNYLTMNIYCTFVFCHHKLNIAHNSQTDVFAPFRFVHLTNWYKFYFFDKFFNFIRKNSKLKSWPTISNLSYNAPVMHN